MWLPSLQPPTKDAPSEHPQPHAIIAIPHPRRPWLVAGLAGLVAQLAVHFQQTTTERKEQDGTYQSPAFFSAQSILLPPPLEAGCPS